MNPLPFCVEDVGYKMLAYSTFLTVDERIAIMKEDPLSIGWYSDLQNPDICSEAAAKDERARSYFIKKIRHTHENYLAEAKRNGMSLGNMRVRSDECSNDVFKAAVRNCGYALKFVPEEFRTIDLCNIAIRNDPRAIKFV